MRLPMALAAMVLVSHFAPADESKTKDEKERPKGRPAEQLLAEGLASAKADSRVFLVFGSPTCGWCRVFEKYHDDPEVAAVLKKHVVLVKVDIVDNPGGEDLYKRYGPAKGVPTWAILDADRKVLADSGDGKTNVGFPYEPGEVAHYRKAMKAALPKVTEEELEGLVKKLADIRAKREKK